MKAVITGLGIILMILAAGGLLLATRDLVIALRFGGFIGDYNLTKMFVDGAIAAVFFGIGFFLLREPLKRKTPRIVLGIAVVVAVLLGANAGFMS